MENYKVCALGVLCAVLGFVAMCVSGLYMSCNAFGIYAFIFGFACFIVGMLLALVEL